MNLYFYGGSFDPPHLGHREIINYFLDSCDKLLIIPSYHSPHKSYRPVPFSHRKKMLEIMFSNSSGLEIIGYEEDNSIKYTFKTIEFLKNKYPKHSLNMILGLDQFNSIDSWKNNEYILSNVNLLVISRPGHSLKNIKGNIKLINDIQIDVSSSEIKNNINNLEKIKPMLDKNVFSYIIKNRLYI
tara:strand:- start:52 stop:606 length:555 start_codon:yes stop_codon:yes gene_type:complete